VLPVVLMALALGAYVVLHSPLRGSLERLFGGSPTCFSFCQTQGEAIIASQATASLDIAAAVVAGFLLSGVLGFRGVERIVAFGLLAFGFVAVPAALLGGFGDVIHVHLLRAPYGPALASLPAVGTIGVLLARGWRPSRPRWTLVRISPLALLMLALGAAMLVISAGVATSHPPTGYDELGYHGPLAVFFWRDGSMSDFLARFPLGWPLAQPGSAELWFGLLRLVGGEPLMVLGQVPFALLGAAGVAAFGKRLGLSSRAAMIGSLTYLLVPIVINQAGRIDDDVVGAALMISAAALVAAPVRTWTLARVSLIGLSLGLMVVTKLALLPAAAAIGLVLVWSLARREPASAEVARGAAAPGDVEPAPANVEASAAASAVEPSTASDRTGARVLLTRGLPIAAALALVAVAPWWLRNLIMFANPLYPTSLPFWGHGIAQTSLGMKDLNHVPSAWLWPLYPLFEPTRHDSGIGAVFAAAIVPGGLIALARAKRRPLLIIAAVALVSLPAWWLATRHEPRFLLGLFGLLIALVPFALAGIRPRWRPWAVGLVAIAAVCSAAVTVSTDLAIQAHHPVDRIRFYDALWREAPALLELPEVDAVLLDDLCSPVATRRIYPALGSGQNRSVARVRCGLTSAQIVAALGRYGMRYVYATSPLARAATLDARYPSGTFELVARSPTEPRRAGGELDRRLYRLAGTSP
jgi:hypothetical protein